MRPVDEVCTSGIEGSSEAFMASSGPFSSLTCESAVVALWYALQAPASTKASVRPGLPLYTVQCRQDQPDDQDERSKVWEMVTHAEYGTRRVVATDFRE